MPKTLPQRFFLKEGYKIAVLNAPEYFLEELLVPLPNNNTISTNLETPPFDVQMYFITTKEDANKMIPMAKKVMKPNAYLWFCYPKGGAKAKILTDMNRDSLWALAITHGLKAVHQISIDDTWSAVRFRIGD